MRILYLFLLFLVSCAQRHFSDDQFPYHDDGNAKPKVAIVPVITSSAGKLPWNLSEELTTLIYEQFLETKQFFLTKDFSVLGKHLVNLSDINPLISDIRWLHENASSSEFVVFVELVEHKLKARSSKIPPQSYELSMALRTHVVDIRGDIPKIILQELIQDSFYIPLKIDFDQGAIRKRMFYLSPLGLAHTKMTKKISVRIQDYILLARL